MAIKTIITNLHALREGIIQKSGYETKHSTD